MKLFDRSNSRSSSPLLRLLGLFNIAAFLRWWGNGLLLWLPGSMRSRLAPTPTRLVIDLRANEMVLLQEKGKTVQELERYPVQALNDGNFKGQLPKVKDKQIVLRLAADRALEKTLPLPAAAEANLRQVIGFEIDRLTPFSPDKVYYDAQVISRQPEARTIRVKFVMVLRSVVDDILQQLAALRLSPDVVDVSNIDAHLNLLPMEKRPRKAKAAGRISGILWILILLSLLAAAILPLWQQRAIVLALMPKVDTAQQQAEIVVALRTELEDTITSSQFLLQKRLQNELVIELINEITTILPDNTWVEQLVINGDEVQVRGQSLAAATLISIVEASEKFENATFRSPVVQDRRTGRDRFFLSAQIRKKTIDRENS